MFLPTWHAEEEEAAVADTQALTDTLPPDHLSPHKLPLPPSHHRLPCPSPPSLLCFSLSFLTCQLLLLIPPPPSSTRPRPQYHLSSSCKSHQQQQQCSEPLWILFQKGRVCLANQNESEATWVYLRPAESAVLCQCYRKTGSCCM